MVKEDRRSIIITFYTFPLSTYVIIKVHNIEYYLEFYQYSHI